MSYANGTTHYNLPQTVGTDKRDWFDTNQPFADIDEAIYGAVEDSATAASGVTALGTRVGVVETDVAGLKESRTTDESRISALEKLTTQHTTDIAGVKADALDMICAVNEGTAQVATVAVSKGQYFRYNDVLYMATTNIAVGDTIVPNTNCRATNVATELENISPSGEVVDVTARQGVAANASHIGTLANLQTTDKTSLVAAINEVLSQIGGGRMLDLANKVKHQATFTTQNDGVIIINTRNAACTIDMGGVTLVTSDSDTTITQFDGISAGTVVTITGTISGRDAVYEVPYL